MVEKFRALEQLGDHIAFVWVCDNVRQTIVLYSNCLTKRFVHSECTTERFMRTKLFTVLYKPCAITELAFLVCIASSASPESGFGL